MSEGQGKAGWMQDDNGNKSSMRLMSLFSLIAAIGIAFTSICMNQDHSNLVLLFLVGAFAPKLFQKFAEKWQP